MIAVDLQGLAIVPEDAPSGLSPFNTTEGNLIATIPGEDYQLLEELLYGQGVTGHDISLLPAEADGITEEGYQRVVGQDFTLFFLEVDSRPIFQVDQAGGQTAATDGWEVGG